MERKSKEQRKTKETDISVELALDTLKESKVDTGVPFFDHMLDLMSRHGRFYLGLVCRGDNEIDDHHSVEDVGIVLGTAVRAALGNRAGIQRFGEASIPMDDSLAMTAIDISGRPFFTYQGQSLDGHTGNYNGELTLEFLRAFALNAAINVHVHVLYGDNRHHIHEAIFKSLGVALYRAMRIDEFLRGSIPSTKGTIT